MGTKRLDPGSFKIWYLLPEMKMGGAEKHVIQLAGGLRRRGYDTRIACVFQEGALAEEVRKEYIPFRCFHARGWGLGTLLKIFHWLWTTPMNVLHTYLFGFHFFGGFPARVLRVPVVISSRREIAYWQKRRHLWLENAGNLFADHVICCSKAAQNWTLKKERGQAQKTAVIYNGVDLTRFGDTVQGLKIRREFGIPYQAPLVGTVANFSFEKGYVYLLEAIGFVLKENPETWFLLVGGGTLHDEIKQKAKQIPRFGQIVFTGFRSDIPELIDAMDVFTLASVIEGFPNVLLEAMAMAKPIVATETGGIPELIQTGREGVLVPPGNSKALADAILAFFKDRMWASRLGVQGQERIRLNFTLERMVDDYENFYLSSLRKRRPERGKNQEDRTKSVAEPSSVFMEH